MDHIIIIHKSCDHYSYSLFKIMSIIKRVAFGNRHILTRSDGFVKCYTKGWVNSIGYVNAPFDDNGITFYHLNGKAAMYKYDLKIIVSRSFLPGVSNELDGWKSTRYIEKMGEVFVDMKEYMGEDRIVK